MGKSKATNIHLMGVVFREKRRDVTKELDNEVSATQICHEYKSKYTFVGSDKLKKFPTVFKRTSEEKSEWSYIITHNLWSGRCREYTKRAGLVNWKSANLEEWHIVKSERLVDRVPKVWHCVAISPKQNEKKRWALERKHATQGSMILTQEALLPIFIATAERKKRRPEKERENMEGPRFSYRSWVWGACKRM